ncbi:MAG: hypothetical protein IKI09_03340 [Bacteroidales bacterium]|nr:hypothetical protein [Bacteroidales bacterium]
MVFYIYNIGVRKARFLLYLNFFLLDNQQYVLLDEIFLKKVIAGWEKGSTFAPAFGRELGLSEGSTGAQVL